jgi:hypothetical protein
LPSSVAAQVSIALAEGGLVPASASAVSMAIGAHVGRAVQGVGRR